MTLESQLKSKANGWLRKSGMYASFSHEKLRAFSGSSTENMQRKYRRFFLGRDTLANRAVSMLCQLFAGIEFKLCIFDMGFTQVSLVFDV